MRNYLLPLLLAASAAHAAPLDSVSCTVDDAYSNGLTLEQAQIALAKAEANPGAEHLALADAMVDLASALSGRDDPEKVAQLTQRALAIWSEAKPGWRLAERLRSRGRGFFLSKQCALAWPVLQAALAMTEKANGADARLTLLALHDILSLAIARDDATAVNMFAPRLLKAWDEHGVPSDDNPTGLYENLSAYYYGQEQYAQPEALVRQRLEQATAAFWKDTDLIRQLTYEMASVYYGQRRYADAEALLAQFPSRVSPLPEPSASRKRKLDEMAGKVRAGDLKGALALGQSALAQYEAELERSRRALVAAEDAAAHAQAAQRPKAEKELENARSSVNADFAEVTHMQGYIGEIHHGMNDLAQAEGMYVLALAQYTKMAIADTIGATRIKTDLAVLYRMRGEPARALPLQQEALATMLDLLGPDHPDVRETKEELALIDKAMKR